MPTNTITNRNVEGNRRVYYGEITGSSDGNYYFKTGLRQVDQLEVRVVGVSGSFADIVYPTAFPALDTTSGHFQVWYTATSGEVHWKAVGKV